MSGANGLGSIYCSHHIYSADPALFSHLASPDDHSYPSSSLGHTSIKAAGHSISLAGGTLKEGCRPVDEGTSLAGLCLGPPTVPELGAHHQKALGWGLWGHQPRTESGGDDRRGQDCVTRPKVRPQQALHSSVPPSTILHSPERGDLGKGGLAVLTALPAPLHPHSLSHPSQSTQGRLTGRMCGAQCRPSRAAWLSGGWGA